MEKKTCLVCNAPLSLAQALSSNHCAKEECRRTLAAILPGRGCVVCGRPLQATDASWSACTNLECQSIFLGRKHAEAVARQRAAHIAEARIRRIETAKRLNIIEPQSYAIQLLPAFGNAITQLPEERKDVFRENLRQSIEEALLRRAATSDSISNDDENNACESEKIEFLSEVHASVDCCNRPDVSSETTAVIAEDQAAALGEACATCRGFCCRNGAEHAFLTADVMVRQFENRQNLSAREMHDSYCSFLPAESFEDSCVFQGVSGCTLPGEMRAGICHEFFCPDLLDFKSGMDERNTVRAFLVAANGDGIQRTKFVGI